MPIVSLVLGFGMLGPSAVLSTAHGEAEAIRAQYAVDLVATARATFALPEGRRTIERFSWIPDPETTPGNWRSARLRLVWNGDDLKDAGVDVPLGWFVSPDRGDSDDGDDGTPRCFVNRHPMPYRSGGRLVIDTEGPVRGTFWLNLGPGGPDLDERGYLRAEINQDEFTEDSTPTGPDEALDTSADADGASPSVRFWYDEEPGP